MRHWVELSGPVEAILGGGWATGDFSIIDASAVQLI